MLLGPMPTPAIAMLTRSMRADIGVMISASHNAYEDNGIKLFGPDGFKLSRRGRGRDRGPARRGSRPRACRSRRRSAAPRGSTARRPATSNSPSAPCPATCRSTACASSLDCANGAAYKVAPEALWELGAEVFSIGVEPDGFNINHNVGSTSPEALVAKVREMRADVGIALDGDADRLLMVDEKGDVVDGDQIMAVIAQSWMEDGRLAKPGLVTTVMSNLGLERYLEGLGLSMVRTAVGDRYVLEHMREHGFNVGGEQSGHIILSDYLDHRRRPRGGPAGPGRGEAARPAGQRGLPPLRAAAAGAEERPLRRPPHPGAGRRHAAPSMAAASGSASRAASLIRPSGTEPVIRVMGEGDDRVLVESVVDDVCAALSAHAIAMAAE